MDCFMVFFIMGRMGNYSIPNCEKSRRQKHVGQKMDVRGASDLCMQTVPRVPTHLSLTEEYTLNRCQGSLFLA